MIDHVVKLQINIGIKGMIYNLKSLKMKFCLELYVHQKSVKHNPMF